MNRKILGAKLKERRKEIKESMESLADEFISAATIGNIERGLPNVTEEKMEYYAKKIGMSGELFGIISEAEKKEKELEAELLYLEDIISADIDNSLHRLEGEWSFLKRDSRLSALYHYLLGRCYFGKRKKNNDIMLRKAEKHFSEVLRLLEKSPELSDSNLQAASLNEQGRIYYHLLDIEKALEHTENGIKAFREDGKRQENIYFLLLNKANYLEQLNRDELALKTLEQLWERLSVIDGTKVLTLIGLDAILQMYVIFAGVLTKSKHYKSALEFADEGVRIARINGKFDKLVSLWITIGEIYESMNDTIEAEKYYFQALSIREKVEDQDIFYALTNLGKLYIAKQEYEKSHSFISEAFLISENNRDELAMLDSLILLGNCYHEQKQYQKAINPLQKAFELAKKYKLIKKQHEVILGLCYGYKKIEDHTSYMQCLEKMFELQANMKWGIQV
ncbi:helix-turn-helix transcriptional regulator [Shimazuella sp. AN120528]|uniref:tetratricopeptide repeat protein n=1 Tax=Shimazuella soli TaxID=1892854 RepID=UPI001F112614|nr:tetratricopeptide repeat protein [Shimazuella soli]MCH5584439.1 helix-turn-helix transcriptional regulator [Shimazuella soli]